MAEEESRIEYEKREQQLKFEQDKKEKISDFNLLLHNFPLDLLSLNPLEVPITGEISSELFLHQEERELTGNWKASLTGFQVGPIQTAGQLKGDLEKEKLFLSGNLGSDGKKQMSLELSLPIQVLLSPPQIDFFWEAPVDGQFFYEGKVEDLLDFANLGTHHLSGDSLCDLTLIGTLAHPSLKGSCTFKNGVYENYLTGTKLTQIDGKMKATGSQVDISLSGSDLLNQGKLEGDGVIELNIEEKLPFSFHINLQEFAITQIDLVSSRSTGHFTVAGNWEGAHLQGALDLLQTKLHIPSHIPNPLPELTVVYRNTTKPPPSPPEKEPISYPVTLDLNLQTPKGIQIDGKGLNSLWNGSFHLGGTTRSLVTDGKLDLIEGQFLFA
ncbi:MAG: translocation/assembly module TamB domain-containing protein, partial [Chlamydiia bacterium]|nr:translocation/assembly module TamB domain-containing protein [Chlamydiia bacterium]